jgi:hypothetical protein
MSSLLFSSLSLSLSQSLATANKITSKGSSKMIESRQPIRGKHASSQEKSTDLTAPNDHMIGRDDVLGSGYPMASANLYCNDSHIALDELYAVVLCCVVLLCVHRLFKSGTAETVATTKTETGRTNRNTRERAITQEHPEDSHNTSVGQADCDKPWLTGKSIHRKPNCDEKSFFG